VGHKRSPQKEEKFRKGSIKEKKPESWEGPASFVAMRLGLALTALHLLFLLFFFAFTLLARHILIFFAFVVLVRLCLLFLLLIA